ncbi:MAG TPA: hypothetical protein VEK11_17115 [Thermoanaerobaculia bacterium]|nr:hypothetical protein [Thermoanaerobaculia bacterium]
MPHESVVGFLRFFVDHHAGSKAQIASAAGLDEGRVDAYGEILSAFGLLRANADGWCRVPDAEHSGFLLRSMHDILASGQRPVLENFREEGAAQTWVAVLRALETRRISLVPGAGFLRRVAVSQALIVGQSQGERFVLVEWDTENWHTVKLIGGKAVEEPLTDRNADAAREEPVQTISRELREELDQRFHETFTLAEQPLLAVRADMVSKTRGARTGYSVFLFPIVEYAEHSRLRFRGSRAQSLKWLAVDDLEHGIKNYPAVFFAETFTAEVMTHLREHPIVYDIPPADLVERRLRLGELIKTLMLRADVLA